MYADFIKDWKPTGRLIDADALKAELLDTSEDDAAKGNGIELVLTLLAVTLDAAPTIDPGELRPRGEWADHMVRDWRCSECGEKINKVRKVDGYCYDDKPNFCPNCGADMRWRKIDGC